MPRTYVTSFPDESVVRWKPISWDEYRTLVKEFGEPATLNEVEAASFYYNAALFCVLDQVQGEQEIEFDELFAGTVLTVGQQIIKYTGFSCTHDEVSHALGAARGRLRADFYESALAMVCVAFNLKPDEVRAWDRDTFLDHVAMVEIATGNEMALEDPSQKATVQPTQFMDHDGKRIPLLTKDDLTQRKEIDIETDNRGLKDVDGFDSRLRGIKKSYV